LRFSYEKVFQIFFELVPLEVVLDNGGFLRTAKKLPRRRRGKAKHRAMVLAAPEGKIRFADPSARRWLAEFFGRAGRPGMLPHKLRRWLEKPYYRKNRPSLVASKNRAHLYVKQQETYTDGLIVLLLELIKGKREERARLHRRLTSREREVLFWLAQGKSNGDIAVILGITTATVGKHLERIYPKLGVENRAAAALSFFSDKTFS
jgi:DNA-binding CsgD family transcriptional regulator